MEVVNGNQNKKNKKKLKKLYTNIRNQMEFYFSDSNLAKDKFLFDLISKDPSGYVDLEVFKTFNKIKALTDDKEIIANAISRSSILEISEDKKQVRRITEIEIDKDFDACTLYVERLPPHADQKWLKDVFTQFGVIEHVNIPRYKTSSKIKGFAFVEFQESDSVAKACEFYKDSAEKESSSSEEETDIGKKGAAKKSRYESSEKKHKRDRTHSSGSDKVSDASSLNLSTEVPDKVTNSETNQTHQKNKKKRKLEDEESDVFSKKLKQSEVQETFSELELKDRSSVVNFEADRLLNKEENSVTPDKNQLEHKSKSKRKRKTKKPHNCSQQPILRVMSKFEWKSYRNKYLDLQRSTMSMLKKQVLLEYQEMKEHDMKPMDVPETKKTLSFQPGVIIKVHLNEPVKNASNVKDQVKANAAVAFVDASIESSEIYIRCHNSEDAESILKESKLSHLGSAELLKELEEKSYWDKIESDRRIKFSNPVPSKKRGRDKLLAKASKIEEMKNKHIFFDE